MAGGANHTAELAAIASQIRDLSAMVGVNTALLSAVANEQGLDVDGILIRYANQIEHQLMDDEGHRR